MSTNNQAAKGPSILGLTAPKNAPLVGFIDPDGNIQAGTVDASGKLIVAVTGAGSGGTSSVDESSFAAGVTAGTPSMGVYEASPTTLTTGQLGVVGLASDRSMKVTITGGGGSGGTSSSFGAAFPATGTAIGISDPGGTMKALSGSTLDYDTGAGTVGQTVMGIALPASGGPVAGGTATNPIQVSLANTGANATAVKTDASASTQPVSGSLKWKATGASGGTVLTTELNSLANGAFSAYGTEINNATGLHTYGWLDVVLASLNPTSGASMTLFMVPTYDGTNYPDVPSTTNPAAQFIVQTIDVATGSAAKRVGTGTFRIPPFKVKFVLLNSTNVALGASSNTVTLYTSEQGF